MTQIGTVYLVNVYEGLGGERFIGMQTERFVASWVVANATARNGTRWLYRLRVRMKLVKP